jgi:hypothetical protein
MPAKVPESAKMLLVALIVSGNLPRPVFSVALGHANASGTIVSMPETAMDKNSLAPSYECDVRLTGKFFSMEPVANGSNQAQ